PEGGAFGVAALDLSTGELSACSADDATSVLSELVRLDPREVLLAPEARSLAGPLGAARRRIAVRTAEAPLAGDAAGLVGGRSAADAILDAQLGAGEAAASGAPAEVRRAAARCIATARACEAGRPLPIARLAVYSLGDTLVLDEATQSHLELVR